VRPHYTVLSIALVGLCFCSSPSSAFLRTEPTQPPSSDRHVQGALPKDPAKGTRKHPAELQKTTPVVSEGCDDRSSTATSFSGGVEWDPITIWDGPNPGEPIAFFLIGTVLFSAVFIVLFRVRTSRRARREDKSTRLIFQWDHYPSNLLFHSLLVFTASASLSWIS